MSKMLNRLLVYLVFRVLLGVRRPNRQQREAGKAGLLVCPSGSAVGPLQTENLDVIADLTNEHGDPSHEASSHDPPHGLGLTYLACFCTPCGGRRWYVPDGAALH